ncbi:MAG: hypothetical protein GVY10_01050, partial [Verrucomicrobia bacterium]|nr:hypothetical protein [Verrucomicrobiota bacterium]
MCGICGERRFDGNEPGAETLRSMMAVMQRRGPDGVGLLQRGPVAFGHRRLKIIDLSD